MLTKLIIGYSDFRALLNVDESDEVAFGLELRQDGVYVKPLDELEKRTLIPSDLEQRLKHPTGNIEEPALSLPCSLEDLRRFVDFYGIENAIWAFALLKLAERKMFEHVEVDAAERYGAMWPIVSGLYGIRNHLQTRIDRGSAAPNRDPSELLALREIAEQIDDILPDPARIAAPAKSQEAKGPREDREQSLLTVIAALWSECIAAARIPGKQNPAADRIASILSTWGVTKPGSKTIADTILNRALPMMPKSQFRKLHS
jgi:hypothetical protein